MSEALRLDFATNDKEVIAAFKRQQAEMEKERKARADLQKQIEENAKAHQKAAKAGIDASKAVAAEQAKLAADAAKIAASVRTPIETFRIGLADLQKHMISGRLSSEQYRKAVDQLRGTYDDATGKSQKRKEALQAESAEAKEAEQITRSFMTVQEKFTERVARLNALRDKGKISAQTHAKAIANEKASMEAATPQVETFGQKMGAMAAGVLTANAAMAAGQKVVGLLREEYDRLIQRQEKAAGVQISLAGAQELALSNLDTSMTPEAFLETMKAKSNELGMSEQQLTIAAADSLSAKGDKSAIDAIGGVVAAAKFRRFASAQEQAGLAGTALDFGKAFKMTPEESIGFLAQGQKLARVTTSAGMSENIAPAIVGASNFGVDRQTAMSMAASLTATSVDKTGAQTKTTMMSLLEQLETFAEGGGAKNALDAIQQDAKLRDEFLEKASFEKQMIPAVRSLLTQGTQGFAEFKNAQVELGKMTPQQAFDAEIAKKSASTAIQVATLDQTAANMIEQQQLSDPKQAISGVIRKRIAESRDALGKSGISTRMTGLVEDFLAGGEQTPQTMINALEAEKKRLTGAQAVPNFGTVANTVKSELTEDQKRIEKLLQQQIDAFKALADAMEKNAAAQALNRQAGVVNNRMQAQGEGAR